MKSKRVAKCVFLSMAAFLGSSTSGWGDVPVPLADEYSIGVTATAMGAQSWEFAYTVTNNNQGDNLYNGFCGFAIQVPISATISNVTDPPPCGKTGWTDPHWVHWFHTDLSASGNAPDMPALPGYQWLNWQGQNDDYAPGATVAFSFLAEGVNLGNTPGVPFTYWCNDVPSYPYYTGINGGNYTLFSTTLVGPVATPEPSSLVLLCIGAASLLACAWRRRRQAA